jgi:hypothetical protein
MNIVDIHNYVPSNVVGGRGGGSRDLYDKLTASVEALKGKYRPAHLLGLAGKRLGGEVGAASLIVKTVTYHAQVQERVRHDDPAQPMMMMMMFLFQELKKNPRKGSSIEPLFRFP